MKPWGMLIIMIMMVSVIPACGACSNTSKEPSGSSLPETTDKKPAGKDTISFTGMVTWVDLEGGFFALHGDDGEKYEPKNIPESFKEDGLRVEVIARIDKDAMSFRMYGTIIEILDISRK